MARFLRKIGTDGKYEYYVPSPQLENRVGKDMKAWEGDLKKAPMTPTPEELKDHPSTKVLDPKRQKRNWRQQELAEAEANAKKDGNSKLSTKKKAPKKKVVTKKKATRKKVVRKKAAPKAATKKAAPKAAATSKE